MGGWIIRYPLPDGSPAQLTVAHTRPSVLREGMTVPVLVDALNPRNARLDHAPYRRVRTTVLVGVIGCFSFVLLTLMVMGGLFFVLSRL